VSEGRILTVHHQRALTPVMDTDGPSAPIPSGNGQTTAGADSLTTTGENGA
jgi:hypothetical protein